MVLLEDGESREHQEATSQAKEPTEYSLGARGDGMVWSLLQRRSRHSTKLFPP